MTRREQAAVLTAQIIALCAIAAMPVGGFHGRQGKGNTTLTREPLRASYHLGSPLSDLPPDINPRYFPASLYADEPPGTLWAERSVAWQLRLMKEPSLYRAPHDLSVKSYRVVELLAIRGTPQVVRISSQPDGTATLYSKSIERARTRGSPPLLVTRKMELKVSQLDRFRALIHKSGFWTLPTKGPAPPKNVIVIDGVDWIVEGVKDGKYHIVERADPRKGSFTKLCSFVMRLGKLPEGLPVSTGAPMTPVGRPSPRVRLSRP